MATREAIIQREDVGAAEGAEALIKKHEDFTKTLAVQDVKINALKDNADRLTWFMGRNFMKFRFQGLNLFYCFFRLCFHVVRSLLTRDIAALRRSRPVVISFRRTGTS